MLESILQRYHRVSECFIYLALLNIDSRYVCNCRNGVPQCSIKFCEGHNVIDT